MPHYKRSAGDRDVTFRRPDFQCFSCHDTGIVVNPDGLLTELLGDYDIDSNGVRHGGIDCAVICNCYAAYTKQDPDGQVIRQGFREDSGSVRQIETEQGPRFLGVGISGEHMQFLHSARVEAWQQTVAEMAAKQRSADRTPTDAMKAAKAFIDSSKFARTNSGFSSLADSLPKF